MFSFIFPYSVHIGSMLLPLHGVFETLGIFIAFRYYLYLKTKQGDTVDAGKRIYIIVGAAMGAVIGARIIGSLENLPEWMAAPNKIAYFNGNKTLVGGLLGGLCGVELTKKIVGEQQNTGDLFTFPLILGMMVGRIGCFTAGIYEETYGTATSVPWGIDLGDGLHRHPVTLYEILFLLCLWATLALLNKRVVLQQGAVFKIFLICYLTFRLLLDLIKPGYRYFLGLGTIQLTCIAGLLYYIRYLLHPRLLTLRTDHAR